MAETIIIIGAGVAGLAAGCYAQMNGYQATILEMANTPGGLCTSWKRKGYLFDGSAAGLAGSAPGSPLYQLWRELGVIQYCELFFGENFGTIITTSGKAITIYSDINRLETHLVEHFPAEQESITTFTHAIRDFLKVDPPMPQTGGLKSIIAGIQTAALSLPHMPSLMKYGRLTIRQFAERFHDPDLKQVFHNIVHFGGADVPMLTMLLPLAYAHRKMAGIPAKGWLDFARAIEQRFTELGGVVEYRAKVSELDVSNGKVHGVILDDGTRRSADRVISAADGRTSCYQFPGIAEDMENTPFRPEKLSDQPVQVNLGVADPFTDVNGPITYLVPVPFEAGGKTHTKITIHTKFYDPSAAPAGCSAVTSFLDSSHAFWKALPDQATYSAEKQVLAQNVIAAVEHFRPGFGEAVQVVDVSTPLTRERFTGNWMGAMQAFAPDRNLVRALFAGKSGYMLDGIKNYYMAGQWVEPWGGITTAAQSGRKVITAICKEDRKSFRTVQ
jgi:phytoene dehydrogenase-like protein